MKLTDVQKADLGCGIRKKEGYFGIDKTAYEGVDLKMDLRFAKLPFEDGQLKALYSSHFLEHLTFEEVLFLMNEAYRVLESGGIFEIIVPHGFSYAGMADLSHKTFWTEDTFGYFTQENKFYYDWEFEFEGEIHRLINKWVIQKNDTTPPVRYTTEGWVDLKLREIDAVLIKI